MSIEMKEKSSGRKMLSIRIELNEMREFLGEFQSTTDSFVRNVMSYLRSLRFCASTFSLSSCRTCEKSVMKSSTCFHILDLAIILLNTRFETPTIIIDATSGDVSLQRERDTH